MTNDLLGCYVHDAWNETDHANELLKNARVHAEAGDLTRTIEDLRSASEAANRAASRVRWALEAAVELQTNGADT